MKDRREKLIDAMLDGRLTEFEARERLDRLNDDIVAAEAVEKEKHIDQLTSRPSSRTRNTFSSTRRGCGSTRISIRSSGYSA